MKNKWNFGFGFGFVLLLSFTLGFLACGDAGQSAAGTAADEKIDRPTAEKTENPAADKQDKMVPKGWKTYQFADWRLSFPPDWGGDEDAGVWWPGEGSMAMGRPPLSVHTGGVPMMPNSTFEGKVNSHMNSEPLSREKFSSSGYVGQKCTWEKYNKKYLGVFLEEKLGGGVGVMHFVNCRAPAAEFDTYKDEFEKIVATFRK